MKKITYFKPILIKETKESVITKKEIIVTESEVNEQLNIINTSYAKYGTITMEDSITNIGLDNDRLSEIENSINNLKTQIELMKNNI